MWVPDENRRRAGLAAALLPALLLLGIGLCATAATAQRQATPQQLEQDIRELREELAGLQERSAEKATLEELERRIELLAQELERLQLGGAGAEQAEGQTAEQGHTGLGTAASKIYRQDRGVSIGGYGEVLYQSAASAEEEEEEGAFGSEPEEEGEEGSEDAAQLDFLRAVLYFGYRWDEHWLFNSEVEFEHASTEDGGEVSVEFAYLDYLWRPQLNVRAGLLLVPMGFLNELHEPPLFLGVERPETEQRILPSTWRENGLGLYGEVGTLRYRSYILGGLDASGFEAEGLREGRQSGAQAKAEDFAWVSRLDWTPTAGLLLGGSVYLGDSGQGIEDASGRALDVGTTLFEAHAEWKVRGLEARALFARADLDDVAALDSALDLTGDASIGERLEGYYLQLGYDLLSRFDSGERKLIPYVRWEHLDTQQRVPAGFAADPAQDQDLLTVGLAFKPLDELVLKLDYLDADNDASTGRDVFHVSLGYLF